MRLCVPFALLALSACGNQPPGVPTISIAPDTPTSQDDLTLFIEVDAIDPDKKDVVSYAITWQVDGIEVDDLSGAYEVPADRTARGQRWAVQVQAQDAIEQGLPAEAFVQINNGLPVVTDVTLTPDQVGTNDVLFVAYDAEDPDRDDLDATVTWRVNGATVNHQGESLDGAQWFGRGDRVSVGVSVNDGYGDSDELVSEPVVVGNTAPGAPRIALSPSSPSEQDDVACLIVEDAYDEDGDALSYTFDWTINGRSVVGEGTTVTRGDTLRASQTAREDLLVCTARADDSNDEGPPATAEVEVSGGVVPGFDGAIGPTFAGWDQCAGYLDRSGGDEVPDRWAPLCAGAAYGRVKMVCGASSSAWRSIDVAKNVFRLGLTGFPERGLVTNTVDQAGRTFSMSDNVVYAELANNPSSGRSWWAGGDGCNESAASVTINNSCPWEVSNCFGQGLSSDRYLWVYVAP